MAVSLDLDVSTDGRRVGALYSLRNLAIEGGIRPRWADNPPGVVW
jgi:hypothetical protein